MADESSDGDSRTSVVGRKRDLHDSTQYRETTDIPSSDDEDSFDRSRKRLKQFNEAAAFTEETDAANVHIVPALPAGESVLGNGEVLKAANTTTLSHGLQSAPVNVQSGAESSIIYEASGDEPLPVLDRGIEDSAKEAALVKSSEAQLASPDMTESGTGVNRSAPFSEGKQDKLLLDVEEAGAPIGQALNSIPNTAQAGRQAAPVGWNQGVRTGLRTTFGNKSGTVIGNKKTLLKIQPPELAQPQHPKAQPRVDKVESFNATSSVPIALPLGISSMFARHQSDFNKVVKTSPAQQRANTSEVDRALAVEKTWPLPSTCDRLDILVARGQTYYPTYFGQTPKPFYLRIQSTKMAFDLPVILNSQGFPYKIQDFSFNIFAPPFLKLNLERNSFWTNGQLRSAFNHYNLEFYSHLGGLRGALQSSAKAPGFLSFEEVLDAAKRLPNVVSTGALGHNPTIGDEPSAAISDAAKCTTSIDPQPSAVSGVTSSAAGTTDDDVKMPEEYDDEEEEDDSVSLSSQMETDTDIEVVEAEFDPVQLALQRKYFPGESESIRRCLACGDLGHWQTNCPALNCTICGENGKHSNFTCPANQRCEKCLGRGHSSTKCPEKLKATRAEAGACDICEARDHLERSCHYIWRSFAPKPEEIRQVRDIPVHCYTCGATGHYGPECGLHSGTLLSGEYTWSQENVRKYVDRESQFRAVSAGTDFSLPKIKQNQKDFNIKGKGKANDPFTIDESDGDDDFIRPKINPTHTQRGHIHFNGYQQQEANESSYHSHITINQNYPGDNMQYNVAQNRDHYNTNSYGNTPQHSHPTFGLEVPPPPPPPPPPTSHKPKASTKAPRARKQKRQGPEARPGRTKPGLNEGQAKHIAEPRAETTTSTKKRSKKAKKRAAAAALAAQNGAKG